MWKEEEAEAEREAEFGLRLHVSWRSYVQHDMSANIRRKSPARGHETHAKDEHFELWRLK
jgi:hypothetical protein